MLALSVKKYMLFLFKPIYMDDKNINKIWDIRILVLKIWYEHSVIKKELRNL